MLNKNIQMSTCVTFANILWLCLDAKGGEIDSAFLMEVAAKPPAMWRA